MELKIVNTCAEDFTEHEFAYKNFLNQIEDQSSPAFQNMGEQEPAGLVYLVKSYKRWTRATGQISFLVEPNTNFIVGVSAVESSSLSDKLGSGGNRCWLLPYYRRNNEVTRYLLSSNLQWCREQGKLGMMLTFNEYNKWIYDTIARASGGQTTALGTVWSDWWNDCVVMPRKIRLFNTPQWAVIKPIVPGKELDELILDIDRRFGVRDKPFITTNA